MFKLNIEGIRTNRFRLFHSKKLRGANFIQIRDSYSDMGDLRKESTVISQYLVEKLEMSFTHYNIFSILSVVLMGLVVLLLTFATTPLTCVSLLFLSFLSRMISKKKRNDCVLEEVGIDMSENFFNNEIREKFNL